MPKKSSLDVSLCDSSIMFDNSKINYKINIVIQEGICTAKITLTDDMRFTNRNHYESLTKKIRDKNEEKIIKKVDELLSNGYALTDNTVSIEFVVLGSVFFNSLSLNGSPNFFNFTKGVTLGADSIIISENPVLKRLIQEGMPFYFDGETNTTGTLFSPANP